MTGRKRHDPLAQTREVFSFAGENDNSVFVVAVVKRADAYWISCGNIFFAVAVIDDKREFRVQHGEHIRAVFPVHGEKYFAVRTAFERIFRTERFLYFFVSVYFAVADNIASVKLKWLHALGGKPHDGKTVKGKKSVAGIGDTAVVGTS